MGQKVKNSLWVKEVRTKTGSAGSHTCPGEPDQTSKRQSKMGEFLMVDRVAERVNLKRLDKWREREREDPVDDCPIFG